VLKPKGSALGGLLILPEIAGLTDLNFFPENAY
jgi:hypothetical protein